MNKSNNLKSVGEAPDDPHHNRRWKILGFLALAQLMVVLDATIVNIALPSAQADLGFGDADRQWIITAYALAFGSLLLLGGRMSDYFGRKRALLVGLTGFAGASALGGIAPSFEVLVGARALQGLFGALLAPAALSTLTTTFTEPGERAKAFGVYGAVAGGGGAVGLLLGGVLTEFLDWRWCMFVNIAIAIPAAIGLRRLLAGKSELKKVSLDIPGALTASLGLFGIVFGFSRAESEGWTAAVTLISLVAGILLLAAFVMIERRASAPLLPLRVVTDRNRAGSYIAVGVAGAAMFGVFLFLTYYLQQTLGFTPVETGLAFLPMIAFLMTGSVVSSTRLMPKVGPRPLVPTGMVLASLGMIWLTGVGLDSTYSSAVLPGLCLVGLGFGMIIAPSMASATLGVGAADSGVASAMVNTTQQVGGSVGTALLSTISASAVTAFASGKVPTADLAGQAAVHGYTTAFWVSAGMLAAGAVITAITLRSGAPRTESEGNLAMAH
ncbi:MAG: MFS transporter [Solirubrobacterales bacterium]|nr:MFS transporter [Solirubrobacterales bacterium]